MIHIESLTKYYNDLCAVDQISFDITKGEIMGLLGPNGAGKTTTLQILTGFLRPTAGSIRVKDYSIDEDSLQIKKLLGYLPESAPLYHDMLVYDYLDYVANLRGIDSLKKISRIRHLADLCGIREVMHKTINELSKGFKQRVGLAHAMMDDPEILVLDEPTSGLDPNQIIEIRDIIKQIGKEKTVILSTHILSEAEATCDRIVIINKGKIVANDTTQTLKQSASGSNLINISLQNAEFESVKQQLTSISEISDIVQVSNDSGILNLKLTCMSSADIRGDVYKKVRQTDWILIEMHQETQTLENIFRELTREN
jgi:gliding motility-associated transport system ATP-binding protein